MRDRPPGAAMEHADLPSSRQRARRCPWLFVLRMGASVSWVAIPSTLRSRQGRSDSPCRMQPRRTQGWCSAWQPADHGMRCSDQYQVPHRQPEIVMTSFVLVHGASHGGWCWRRVASLLREAGHEVLTPTLTGLGESEAALSRDVGLTRHVQDVTVSIKQARLQDVVLVGHSYAGMLLPAAASSTRGRVQHVVFLDAFVPRSGQRCFDLMPSEAQAGIRALANSAGDGWRFPPFDLEVLGVPVEDRPWVQRMLTFHPLLTYDEPTSFSPDVWSEVGGKTYILCTDGAFRPVMDPFAELARKDPAWQYREIAAGHDCMLSAPHELTNLLLEASGTAASVAPGQST